MPKRVILDEDSIQRDFHHIFNDAPQSISQAHARVNLIGEHTDYNRGKVLPALLPMKTFVATALNSRIPQNSILVCSKNMLSEAKDRDPLHISLDEARKKSWTDYVVGSLKELSKYLHSPLPGLSLFIDSNIIQGAGISSSAALEVALIRAVKILLKVNLDDFALAQMAQRAENNYVGMPCGLMDQMVISMAPEHHALYINFYDSEIPSHKTVSLFKEHLFLVISSGRFHELVAGDEGYKTRVLQCKEACRQLNIATISDLSCEDLDSISLDDPLLKARVEHIVKENTRVEDAYAALQAQDARKFGALMTESHASQRDLYHTSIPEIDTLCEVAIDNNALGARLTGGGFGGSIIVLVEPSQKDKVLSAILKSDSHSSLLVELGGTQN